MADQEAMFAPHQENRQAGQEDIYQRWIRRQGRKTIRTLESRIKKLENQFVETRENIEKIKAQRERMIQHIGRRSNRRASVIQRAQVLQNQQENSDNGGGGGAPPATGGDEAAGGGEN